MIEISYDNSSSVKCLYGTVVEGVTHYHIQIPHTWNVEGGGVLTVKVENETSN